MVFLPLGIIGSIVGNMAYAVVPMMSVAILLAIFWGILTIDMIIRAVRMYARESCHKNYDFKMIKEQKKQDIDFEFLEEPKDEGRRLLLEDHNNYDPKTCSLNSSENFDVDLQKVKKFSDHDLLKGKSKSLFDSDSDYDTPNTNDPTSKPSTNGTRSGLITFALSQMRYLDSDDESDPDEHKELFRRVKIALMHSNKNSLEETKHNNLEIARLQNLIELKLKKKSNRLHIELRNIKKLEGSQFGIKTLFILANLSLLLANVFFRGITKVSIFGISQ